MNKINKNIVFWGCIVGVLLSLTLIPELMAAEAASGPSWRPTYDSVMKYVNFLILVFVVYRYARPLLMDFLHGQKDAKAREIKQMEDEKDNVFAKVKETMKMLDESEIRFAELKRKTIERGESKKKEIIEDAKEQYRIMIAMTRQKIEGQIIRAKDTVKAELIDSAIELAMEILPHNITDEDNQKLINQYLLSSDQVTL